MNGIAFILLVICQFSVNEAQEKVRKILPIRPRIGEENVNDTILEVFQNCRCVIYYQCDENNNIITDGTNLIDIRINDPVERISCSEEFYYCCKEPNSATPLNVPSTTTTTDHPEPKNTEIISDNSTRQQLYVDKDEKKLHCGKQRTLIDIRIYSDVEDVSSTIAGEIPWMVAIFQKQWDGTYKFKCGGTLIHAQVVLTATHCIKSAKPEDVTVVASGSSVFQEIGINSNNERRTIKLIKHPDYYSGGLYNDIGLIILSEAYNLSAYPINTVCLANNDDNFDGHRCWAAGWGGNDKGSINKVLRKVELPVVPRNQCQDSLRKSRLGEEFNLHQSFMCAGGEQGRGTCYGDGGGPLVCLKNQRYFQTGVLSWGLNCKQSSQPDLFTDVRVFKDWIDEQLKSLNLL